MLDGSGPALQTAPDLADWPRITRAAGAARRVNLDTLTAPSVWGWRPGEAYLVARAITSARVIAFADLGMEAIHEFEVRDMPVTVAVDSRGNSAHQSGPRHWQQIIRRRQSA